MGRDTTDTSHLAPSGPWGLALVFHLEPGLCENPHRIGSGFFNNASSEHEKQSLSPTCLPSLALAFASPSWAAGSSLARFFSLRFTSTSCGPRLATWPTSAALLMSTTCTKQNTGQLRARFDMHRSAPLLPPISCRGGYPNKRPFAHVIA